jgi:tryptophan synthase alpha chain
MFEAAKAAGHKVVAPFVTAGDPDPAATVAILEALDRAGASLCELGVPYSDPIADGPVIQSSYTRALAHGISLEHVFGIAKQASSGITMPILAMASYSLVFRRGIDRFVGDAIASGLAGFVVPDLPIEESDDLDAACRDAGLALVRLVTPTTPPERAAKIASKSTGFLYCVSVAGVTGARTELPPGLIDRVQWLRTQTDVPILVGFGISSPDQVRAVCQVADGAIVGSALVRLVAEHAGGDRDQLVTAVERFARDLAAAAGG